MIDGRVCGGAGFAVRGQHILGRIGKFQQCYAVLGTFDRRAAKGEDSVDPLLIVATSSDWVVSQKRSFAREHQLGLVSRFLVILSDIDRKTWRDINVETSRK